MCQLFIYLTYEVFCGTAIYMSQTPSKSHIKGSKRQAFIEERKKSLIENDGRTDVEIADSVGLKNPDSNAHRLANHPDTKAQLEKFQKKIEKPVKSRFLQLLKQNANLAVSAQMVKLGFDIMQYKTGSTHAQFNQVNFMNTVDEDKLLDALARTAELRKKANAQPIEDAKVISS